MADQDTPLTSLCSICYTNPPKYVCPRDHVKTCSLPCYKRHQQRASCNGKRDPTAYVKKEQLTTASGIDHDYNFLSGVERVFDKADKDREERGIVDADQIQKRRWHPEGALQKYLRQNQIEVARAPVGMSRQKSNQTRFITKSKRIVWTVEWIDADGAKRLSEAHEAATIAEVYAAMLADKDRESKKRKRVSSIEASSKTAKSGNDPSSEEQQNRIAKIGIKSRPELQLQSAIGLSGTEEEVEASSAPESAAPEMGIAYEKRRAPIEGSLAHTSYSADPQPDDPDQTQDSSEAQSKEDKRSLILSRIQSEQSRQAAIRAAKLPTGPPFFYLLRPQTSASSRVVIPLFPDHSLTSSLEYRTVLEFPTIYVLEQGQDELPHTFITEDAYLKVKEEEEREVLELLKALPSSAAGGRVGAFGESAAESRTVRDELDPSQILEMLKRDVPS
ncbi:hypothetical protein BDV97DRAFT_358130 [Delphinella strobiligena]|nr:hypothetical protein BDV97DRAFT_358130 [Delphinella strobiligena]